VPKIIGGSLEEHRASTRQRVFEAADLAAEAGIGRTAIYNHFADKEAIIVGFAASETSRYLARLDQVLAGVQSPTDRLDAYVRHHIETRGERHFGFGPEINSQLSRATLVQIREHIVAVEGVVRGILADGIAAGEFRIDDVDASVALIHACLQPRHLNAGSVAEFVVRSVRA
jgi:AcrR family transcriptional regulator